MEKSLLSKKISINFDFVISNEMKDKFPHTNEKCHLYVNSNCVYESNTKFSLSLLNIMNL